MFILHFLSDHIHNNAEKITITDGKEKKKHEKKHC